METPFKYWSPHIISVDDLYAIMDFNISILKFYTIETKGKDVIIKVPKQHMGEVEQFFDRKGNWLCPWGYDNLIIEEGI